MDYAKLKSILQDPEYAGLSDSDAATALNTPTVPVTQILTSNALLSWAGADGRLVRILQAAEAPLPEPTDPGYMDALGLKNLCLVAAHMIQRETTYLDLSRPDEALMLNMLVVGGVLTEEEKQSLYALATTTVSRAQADGLGTVLPGHVTKARAL